MDPVALSVILLLSFSTIGLFYYTRVTLPTLMEHRFRESLKAFSTAIELRFPSHKGLTARVVPLSLALGRQLGLNAQELRDLHTSAQLRDIGLCAVPYSLVNDRDWSCWTDAEQATYERHQEVSAAMLETVPSLRHLAAIVRCHHADYDGSDGPYFPAREAQPVQSRILKVVVEYVWWESLQGHLIARDRLKSLSGRAYDPKVVEAFWLVLTSSRVGEPVRSESLETV